MDHQLIRDVKTALAWSGPSSTPSRFLRGTLPNPELCPRLITPTGFLDLIMRRSLVSPQIRCFQDESELHPNSLLQLNRTRRGQVTPMVDMRRLAQLMQSGCTVVLDAVNHFDSTLEVACRAFQWWLRAPVQVNIYLTTGDAAGFSLHWDDHDVIVVQLAGEKEWEIRGPSRSAPMYRDAAPNVEPPQDIMWSGAAMAGDVLHIPRGHWHRASRTGKGDGFSLHATFGFTKRTGVDWLAWLADQARREQVFREDLNQPGEDRKERHSEDNALLDAASRLLTSYPPTNYSASATHAASPGRHVSTAGIFGPLSAVVCVTDFPPRIETRGDTATVATADKRITFTRKATPALKLLLSGNPVRLDYVSSDTGVDGEHLGEVLVREGICAELTMELFSGYIGLTTDDKF
ncbi:JmjC domain-containing protein [Frankia sp. Cj5]|uniref:JmjC domain-containing protein n=2 Tax=unclassified Frankia TaxID=2632575 RepID=UPI00351CE598